MQTEHAFNNVAKLLCFVKFEVASQWTWFSLSSDSVPFSWKSLSFQYSNAAQPDRKAGPKLAARGWHRILLAWRRPQGRAAKISSARTDAIYISISQLVCRDSAYIIPMQHFLSVYRETPRKIFCFCRLWERERVSGGVCDVHSLSRGIFEAQRLKQSPKFAPTAIPTAWLGSEKKIYDPPPPHRAHTATAAQKQIPSYWHTHTRHCGGFIYSPPTAKICLGDIGVIEFESRAGFGFFIGLRSLVQSQKITHTTLSLDFFTCGYSRPTVLPENNFY